MVVDLPAVIALRVRLEGLVPQPFQPYKDIGQFDFRFY